METADWFKPKKYPHIGLPISIKDYKWIKEYVEDPALVKKHSFLPFIHKSIVQRKYRADKNVDRRNPCGKRVRIVGKPKTRPILYSSHLDSQIFSYYNYQLSTKYEEYIKNKNFNTSIVAYRKIPHDVKGNKCNIDFAESAFNFLHQRKEEKHTVIIADITSFFDNLCHKILKRMWTKLLAAETLPGDHYNVYKALTNIRYVEGEDLFLRYDRRVYVEKFKANDTTKRELKRIKINDSKFFKEKNVVAYCTKEDFIKNCLDLVITKKDDKNPTKKLTKGIPQGSPISATLANIYMLEFDQVLQEKITSCEIGGFYQRYSDDLIVICNQKHEDEILQLLRVKIYELVNLEIHPDKTRLYRFENIKGKFWGFEVDEKTKEYNYNKTLEYLGFSYDGNRVLIKTAGFSKFHRAMKRSLRKSTSLAKYSKNPDKRIFKSRLYKRFTHIGASRKLIYRPLKNKPSIYLKTNEFYWGNYLSYIYKANFVMKSINGSDVITHQGSKIWNRFNLLLKYYVNIVSEFHSNN